MEENMKILIVLLLTLVGLILFIIGFQFRKGNWLRLIAGNSFNDVPLKKSKGMARVIGVVLYISSIVLVGLAMYLYILN